MRRQKYHFPLPRRERVTVDCLQEVDFRIPFLEVDRRSIAPTKKIETKKRPERIEWPERQKPRRLEQRIREIPDSREPVESPEEDIPSEVVRVVQIETQPVIPDVIFVEERPASNRVSVIMAHRGRDRLDGLKFSIASIRKQSVDCYIILVEQDQNPVLKNEVAHLVDHYLFTYSPSMFNKSWAFNCGAVIADDEILLFHDSDLVAPENYVREGIQILSKNDLALPWTKILYLTEESSTVYPKEPLKVSHTFSSQQVCGGSLLVRRKFYLEIGGMDERFEGWGGEDNAFFVKACKLGKIGRAHPVKGPTLIHYYHPIAPRSHRHYNINAHVMSEYYSRSVRDIKMRIKSLEPIGNPVKYYEMERRDPVSLIHSLQQGV